MNLLLRHHAIHFLIAAVVLRVSRKLSHAFVFIT